MTVTFKLKILTGKHSGREIEVKRPQFVVGRADDCDLRPASLEVSRRHCAFLLDQQGVKLQDLGGAGRTLVNGTALHGKRDLASGDRIKVGPLEFQAIIAIDAPGPPAKAPAGATTPSRTNASPTVNVSAVNVSTITSPTVTAPAAAKPAAASAEKSVPASGSADDQDVMQWLNAAPPVRRPLYMELKPAEPAGPTADTGQISLDAIQPLSWPDSPHTADPLPESASRSALRRGKLGPAPADAKPADNTQDAASAALDKYLTVAANTRKKRD